MTSLTAAQQCIAKSKCQSHLHHQCIDWERLEAYRFWNSWTCGYIESRCGLECPPHGKADCAFTSTVIGGPSSQKSTQPKCKRKKEKPLVESCGINTLRGASSVELLFAVLSWPSQSSMEEFFSHIPPCNTHLALNRKHLVLRFYGNVAQQIQSHMVCVCAANYLHGGQN